MEESHGPDGSRVRQRQRRPMLLRSSAGFAAAAGGTGEGGEGAGVRAPPAPAVVTAPLCAGVGFIAATGGLASRVGARAAGNDAGASSGVVVASAVASGGRSLRPSGSVTDAGGSGDVPAVAVGVALVRFT